MHKAIWAATLAIAGLLLSVTAVLGQSEPAPIEEYLIGPGDVLDIAVWKNEDLTRRVVVRPDGKISFPLIGEVTANDTSVSALTEELKTRLARYVPDVILSVVVAQVNSLQVYVIGKVNGPGRFVLSSNVTVLQALAMAGGLNPFAKSGRIKIFREQESDIKFFFFDYDEVAAGENLHQNIRLKRGDVIVVP